MQMNEKIRVLHVIGSLRRGGAEQVILNIYRNIDLNKVQFDFMTRGENLKEIEEEIRKKGGNVYDMPSYPKRIFANYRELKSFFEENAEKYQVIHIHANSLMYIKPLQLAKKYNIPFRIVHSHNTKTASLAYLPLHYLNRMKLHRLSNCNLACSEEAGKWMFGKQKYEIVKNAIDVSKFSFNQCVRQQYRENYKLSDELVVGNIGRLVKAKNQEFLIDIFYEICKMKKAFLVIIGEGELEEKLLKKIKKYNLTDRVVILHNISDVYNYLQMMDVFVMPSLYEGLPVSLVEAETSGLGVVIANTISEEAVLIKENISVMSLDANAFDWAKQVIEVDKRIRNNRKSQEDRIAENGFDIRKEVKRIEKFYGL